MKNPKCPKCGKTMELAGKDFTENTETKKQYVRHIFTCRTDDIWVTLEIPEVSGKSG